MDKETLAGMYADFMSTGDESLLGVMSEDVYDNVSGQHGTAIWLTVKEWIEQSFADRTVQLHCAAADQDRVLVWLTVTATHIGSAFPWLGGRPGSGRRIEWRQVHVFRLVDEKVVEHWAVRDDLRVLEAIDSAA
jgi:predicted ester cyclase